MSSSSSTDIDSGVVVTESATKKRKAEEMENEKADEENQKVVEKYGKEEEEEDSEACCNICFEPWSNTGSHRISSLKCGHFFGLSCIEKWLNSTGGNDCPTCNEKANKKDIRNHYVAKLKAIDTGDRDRAIEQVDSLKKELRKVELESAQMKVTCHLQKEEIEKLKSIINSLKSGHIELSNPIARSLTSTGSSNQTNGTISRLIYVQRLQIIRPDISNSDVNKACRVVAYNEVHGMLVVSQPSFTALAPGFGVRRINMLDIKIDQFVSLHKEPIRDIAFNSVHQDQLLSVSQDKTIRLTNISSKSEIQRFHCESEVWACCWNTDNPFLFYVGTKRSQILIYDTRESSTEAQGLVEFPVQERRPIIAMAYVPKCDNHEFFPCAGLLVMTLGSLWFFEEIVTNDGGLQHKPHKINIEGALFWSMYFHKPSRLLLVSTRPQPHARHIVFEFNRVNISTDVTQGPNYQVSSNPIFDNKRGGSYKERSFLRSTICQGQSDGQNLILYGRGSSHNDHKLVVQEIGSGKVLQEIKIEKPILDICAFVLNTTQMVCVLTENELHVYKW